MSRKTAARFDTHLKRLRKYGPQQLAVTVKLVANLKKKTRDTAWCSRRGDRFLIEIDAGVSEDMKNYLLIHEWAHAQAWDAYDYIGYCPKRGTLYKMQPDHGHDWGAAFALCYRIAAEGYKPSWRRKGEY